MDETTFFRQTIADGGDVVRARANLGVAYSHEAISEHKTAADEQAAATLRDIVHRYPKVIGPRINLANSLARNNDLAGAKSILEKVAADIYADQGGDAHELVTTLRSLDILEAENPIWPDRRAALLSRGSLRFPNSWELVEYHVRDLVRADHAGEALASAQRFADAHWWQEPARFMVGQLQAEQGQTSAALASWHQASRLDVHDAEAFSSAALLCLHDGQVRAACDLQARAVQRQPDSPTQHALYSQVLEEAGERDAARAQAAVAQSLIAQLDPK